MTGEILMDSTSVLIVTYNRSKLLLKTLNGVLNQTKHVSEVLIFNNHGTDDTEKLLKKEEYLDSSLDIVDGQMYKTTKDGVIISYYLNDKNLGGAGGFSKGIKLISEQNYDWLWVMDDDVVPEDNCLEEMFKQVQANNVQVGIPNRSDDNFTDTACIDFDFDDYRKFWIGLRKKSISIPKDVNSIFVKDFPFEGPLIKMDLVKKIGLPDSRYFIEYDDSDYAQRLQQYTKIVLATKATLHRQLAKKRMENTKKTEAYNWRNYYKIRNNIIFDRRYTNSWKVKLISPIILTLHHLVISCHTKNLRKNTPIILKAYFDGMLNKMGKRVNPNY